jgi:hypothetical protein
MGFDNNYWGYFWGWSLVPSSGYSFATLMPQRHNDKACGSVDKS